MILDVIHCGAMLGSMAKASLQRKPKGLEKNKYIQSLYSHTKYLF